MLSSRHFPFPLYGLLVALAWLLPTASAPAAPTRLEGLPQLAAPVTVEFVGTPLLEVLKELAEKRGVRLTIKEPVLRRRRMYLLAKEQSAGKLLVKVAEVVGAAWVPQGAGYELRRTRQATEEARAYRFERARRMRLLSEIFYKRHRRALQIGLAEARVPPPLSEDRVRAPYVVAENAALAPVVSALSETQLRQIFDADRWALRVEPPWPIGEEQRGLAVGAPSDRVALSIRAVDLPARGREALASYFRSQASGPEAANSAALAADPDLALHFAPFTTGSMTVIPLGGSSGKDGGDLKLFQGIDAGWEDPKFELNEGLSPNDLALLAWWFPRWRHAGSYAYDPGKVTGLGAADAKRPLPLDSERMPRKGKFWLGEALQALHAGAAYTIIGDYFTRPFLLNRPTETPESGLFLNELSETFGRDFRVEGGTLTFRSTTWPEDEAAEPDAAFVDTCLAEKREQGHLASETWLQMGALPREQLATLCLISELHGKALMEEAASALGGKRAIDFYQELRPNQRAKAVGGEKDREKFLTWRDLDPIQKRKAIALGLAVAGPRLSPERIAEQFRLTVRSLSAEELKKIPAGSFAHLTTLSIFPCSSASYQLLVRPPVQQPMPQ